MSKDVVKDTGIYTKDGNVAGMEATLYALEREKFLKKFEDQRQEIDKRYSSSFESLQDSFTKAKTSKVDKISKYTVGLHTLEDYKNIREKIENEQAEKLQKKQEDKDKLRQLSRKKLNTLRQKSSQLLTFDIDENDSTEPINTNKYKVKRARVDDIPAFSEVDKELKEKSDVHKYVKEWQDEQEKIKKEMIDICYSYYDGKSHLGTISVEKGSTIYSFLDKVRKSLQKTYPELSSLSTEDLMYIKEDAIINTSYTFYKLIVTKATHHGTPLYIFKTNSNVTIHQTEDSKKQEIHTDKIVDRRWYERNKHIYPASKWESFILSQDQEKTK